MAGDIIAGLSINVARLQGRLIEKQAPSTTRSFADVVISPKQRHEVTPPKATSAQAGSRGAACSPSEWQQVTSKRRGPSAPLIKSHFGTLPKTPRREYAVTIQGPADTTETTTMNTLVFSLTLATNINPVQDGIRIMRTAKTRSGKLLVVARSKADLDKLCTHQALASSGLTVKKLQKRPKIIIYNVPGTMSAGELTQAIWSQNPRLQSELTSTSFHEGIYHLHPLRPGRLDKVSWVVEVAQKVRNALRRSAALHIAWQRCKVLDYLRATRCYRCLDLGHVAKHCTGDPTCMHCGDAHTKEECNNRQTEPRCVPCLRRRKAADHCFTTEVCPTYQLALLKVIQQTDYG